MSRCVRVAFDVCIIIIIIMTLNDFSQHKISSKDEFG